VSSNDAGVTSSNKNKNTLLTKIPHENLTSQTKHKCYCSKQYLEVVREGVASCNGCEHTTAKRTTYPSSFLHGWLGSLPPLIIRPNFWF
jgi:ribosomal protein L37AE/L43A